MNDLIKRKGKFSISWDMIQDEKVQDALFKMFSRVIVVRAENCFLNDIVTYCGMSKDFDVIEPGTEIPKYTAVVCRTDHEEISVQFERVSR